MRRAVLLLGYLLLVDARSQSDTPSPLEISVRAERLIRSVAADGRPVSRYVPARQVRANEEVHYTVRIRNTSDHLIHPVVVTRPVPENTVYVDGSAVGPAATVTFSVDGGQTFDAPDRLEIAAAEGGMRRAGPRDYTDIRWELRYALAAGATAIARFRVTLQ